MLPSNHSMFLRPIYSLRLFLNLFSSFTFFSNPQQLPHPHLHSQLMLFLPISQVKVNQPKEILPKLSRSQYPTSRIYFCTFCHVTMKNHTWPSLRLVPPYMHEGPPSSPHSGSSIQQFLLLSSMLPDSSSLLDHSYQHTNIALFLHLNNFLKSDVALTCVAQWVGHHPANKKVAALIPGQDTHLGCRPGPGLGACERQVISVSLAHRRFSPSPLSPLRLSKDK